MRPARVAMRSRRFFFERRTRREREWSSVRVPVAHVFVREAPSGAHASRWRC